jgi:hypothetical protein
MKTYTTLIAADIYRDGGSIGLGFRCADGTFESIWLRAVPIEKDFSRFAHGPLKISQSAEGAEDGVYVPRKSEIETEVVARITQFMTAPKVDIPISPKTEVTEHLQLVTRLLEAIPHRVAYKNEN